MKLIEVDSLISEIAKIGGNLSTKNVGQAIHKVPPVEAVPVEIVDKLLGYLEEFDSEYPCDVIPEENSQYCEDNCVYHGPSKKCWLICAQEEARREGKR